MIRNATRARGLLLAASVSLIAFASARAQSDGGAPPALALGASAPMATAPLQNIDGKSITIAQAAGKKGTLVIFICNHCPWVKAWQGRIAAVGKAAAAKGIGVIAINSNDPAAYPEDGFDEMVKRAKEVGYGFAYAVDGTSAVARAFGASHTPEAFLFDAKGRLVYHGAVDDNAQDVKAVKSPFLANAVAAVASGRPVSPAETKALGCGIKYRETAVAN